MIFTYDSESIHHSYRKKVNIQQDMIHHVEQNQKHIDCKDTLQQTVIKVWIQVFCFLSCFKGFFLFQHNIRKFDKRKLNGHKEFLSCSLPSLSLQFLEFQGNVSSLNISSNCLAEMLCAYRSPNCTSLNRTNLGKNKSFYFHTDWKT